MKSDEDDLEVGGVEAVGARDEGVDLGAQLVALVGAERPDLDTGRGGEVGEALVGAGEPRGRARDSLVLLVGQLGQPQALEDEEVQVRLDETPRLPVEREAVHQAETAGAVEVATANEGRDTAPCS